MPHFITIPHHFTSRNRLSTFCIMQHSAYKDSTPRYIPHRTFCISITDHVSVTTFHIHRHHTTFNCAIIHIKSLHHVCAPFHIPPRQAHHQWHSNINCTAHILHCISTIIPHTAISNMASNHSHHSVFHSYHIIFSASQHTTTLPQPSFKPFTSLGIPQLPHHLQCITTHNHIATTIIQTIHITRYSTATTSSSVHHNTTTLPHVPHHYSTSHHHHVCAPFHITSTSHHAKHITSDIQI